jgi:hypothetical protein
MPPEDWMTTATQKKGSLREFRIDLVGKRREDGSLFVTSPNMTAFSAVLYDGEWEEVTKYLRKFLEVNFGKVKELRLIHDASELSFNDPEQPQIPPPYVIAGVSERARQTRPSKS